MADPTVAPALARFRTGTVIPAQPLALTSDLELDVRRQRALARYHLAAGAGGLAVGVHTTQFQLHTTHRHLYAPVLRIAREVASEQGDPATIMIAGASGPTEEAVGQAAVAAGIGYHAVLLAPRGAQDLTEAEMIERTRLVGEVLPVIGFYLQPAVGGRRFGREYWRRTADVDSVVGIKVAPFDRYATVDVLAGVAGSDRAQDVALYTGNDDHIIGDLLGCYVDDRGNRLEFVGGLLGQWSVWTHQAVRALRLVRSAKAGDARAHAELRDLELALTDANGAIFDSDHGFHGCLPGIHEVLRRQGLLAGLWCLDPRETLSPGQLGEIDRVLATYPHLTDDDFVRAHLNDWLDASR